MCVPSCLILSPTRELTEQTYKVCRLLLKDTGINCVKLFGGVNYKDQYSEMKPGAEIIIATPGRLLDFLKRGVIVLDQIDFLVLDEADRMLDMGFGQQLNEIIFMFKMPPKDKRQSLLFSATFSREICTTADNFIQNYFIASNNIDFDKNTGNVDIEENFILVDENDKIMKAHELLQQIRGKTISKTNNFILSLQYLYFNT